MQKKWIALLCALMLLGAGTLAAHALDVPHKLKVTVTFNAMREFVTAVGGDKVEIITIVPDGMEPHGFEPKARDIAALSSAHILVYSGLGMEAWVDDVTKAANNPDLIVVDASQGADILYLEDAHGAEHGGEADHQGEEQAKEDNHSEEANRPGQDGPAETDSHNHGGIDPHLWLSLKGAAVQAGNIRDALVSADPANKDSYEQNYAAFAAQLDDLFTEYEAKFQTTTRKSFVTGHAAFGYLCRDFGLHQNSVEDVFAEGQPTAQQLAKLVAYSRDNNVTTIFSESMVSPQVSQTLANEIGAKVETIYTIASNENDLSYLERMRFNLETIYASLTD